MLHGIRSELQQSIPPLNYFNCSLKLSIYFQRNFYIFSRLKNYNLRVILCDYFLAFYIRDGFISNIFLSMVVFYSCIVKLMKNTELYRTIEALVQAKK